MTRDAALISLLSAALFCGLVLIRHRPRGAFLAQLASFAAALVLFYALVQGPEMAGRRLVSGAAVAGLAAALAGMGYHLYLGRFTSIWRARATFAAVYLGISGALGLVYLSLL